jgi:predicted nucleic acid-binding protein
MNHTLYVETSALLRAILEHDRSLDELLTDPTRALVTSALTTLEAARTIARARRDRRLTPAGAREGDRRLAAFERSVDIRAIDDEVLHHARQEFPVEPVRTLDAIHLATLRLFDQEEHAVTLVTCDDRVGRNAAALGFEVVP